MGGDFVHANAAESPPPREHVFASQCPRCGKVAAAAGHATFGEWLDCLDAFRLEARLAKWTEEWPASTAPSDPSSGLLQLSARASRMVPFE